MGEWEEKLNSILGDQNAMGQIMALARSLTGAVQNETDQQSEEELSAMPDLQGLLGQMDPELLQRSMGLLRGMQGSSDRETALLQALRPFLNEKRQEKMDRAVQVLQVTRLLRLTMGGSGEGRTRNV